MNTSLHKQIYENMGLRDSEELLEIWHTNDRVDWSDEAFQVIDEILRSRGVEPPAQNEPILEHEDNEPEFSTDGLTEEEIKIIEDENPPEFYDPFQVMRLGKWLEIAAIVSIVLAVFSGLIEYRAFSNMVQSYFIGISNAGAAVLITTILVLALVICLQFLMTYFPLKALAYILRILMEMEFNSRKPAAAVQPVTED